MRGTLPDERNSRMSHTFADRLIAGLTHRGLVAAEQAAAMIPETVYDKALHRLLMSTINHPEGADFLHKALIELRRQRGRFAPLVRRRFLQNLFGNLLLLSAGKHRRVSERIGVWPCTAVISPSSWS